MRFPGARPAILFCFLSVLAVCPVFGQEDDQSPPQDVGLRETEIKRIVQVDVTAVGPASALRDLAAGDFQVVVDGREITRFDVDPVCTGASGGGSEPAAAERGSVSYMFYFDQFHLKMDGRARALGLARELIPMLVTGSAEAIVVSGGREVRTYGGWTADQAVLLAALDELENDPGQLDPYASGEDRRVAEVLRALNAGLEDAYAGNMENRRQLDLLRRDLDEINFAKQKGEEVYLEAAKRAGLKDQREMLEKTISVEESTSIHRAVQVAENHQGSDVWHTEKGLNRFSIALRRFAGRSAPRAVLYFADTMRADAGAHYLSLFSSAKLSPYNQRFYSIDKANDSKFRMTQGPAVSGYEEVLNEATIHGVRLYTVQAEGLATDDSYSGLSSQVSTASYISQFAGTRRHDDVKSSLRDFASSTGGKSFLNGVRGKKIARAVINDLDCIHLLSFDAAGLPEDRPLSLEVMVRRPRVTVSARSHIIVESESSRMESRIESAFVMPEQHHDAGGIRTQVIPTGFESGKYTALVQLVIPGNNLPEGSWDLGLSLIARGGVRQEVSGRVSVNRPGVPVIFETEMQLPPGPHEIVAVAHDLIKDRILSQRLENELPELKNGGAVVLGPLTLLQPIQGAFLRDGRVRKNGALASGAGDRIDPGLPLAVVGLVCRTGRHDGDLTVERRLSGEETVPFPSQTTRFSEERCFLIRDLVVAGTLTDGMFLYDMTVGEGDEIVAAGNLEFVAYKDDR